MRIGGPIAASSLDRSIDRSTAFVENLHTMVKTSPTLSI
jgi:hypothetical protein